MSNPQLVTNHAILCVDLATDRLFSEVIQEAENRPFYWVRPLILQIGLDADQMQLNQSVYEPDSWDYTVYDVRQSADLILPRSLFRPALDTEVLPLMTQLHSPKHTMIGDRLAKEQMHQFVQHLWRTFPHAFVNPR
ncbi:hypothetical protein ACQ4M4_01990 [Leptolyngbya sp. AN02str]|uniref:hypothetical protein n=1 Tax=Leptolyngbya sp. AN02str TaxID=3423363 RepID=UPI003D31862E